MYKGNIENLGFLVIAFGVVILSAFFLGLPLPSLAGVTGENTGFTSTSTGSITLEGVNINMCKEYDNDIGEIYLELKSGSLGALTHIATSAAISFADIYYGGNIGWIDTSCLNAETFAFPSMPTLTDGTQYAFIFREFSASNAAHARTVAWTGEDPAVNTCLWSTCSYPATWISFRSTDLYDQGEYFVEDVEIVELPDRDYFVQVGDWFLDVHDKKCITGENCYLKMTYPFEMIGDTVNLYRTNSSGEVIELASSTVLEDLLLLKYEYLIDDQAAGTTRYYRAWNNTTLEFSNVANVKWYTAAQLADLEYDIDNACSDMTTTTWEYWDPSTWAGGMGYALECAFRKAGYWAFTVKPSTYLKLDEQKEEFLREFPFNIFYTASGLVDIASSTATSTWDFDVNWIASGSTSTLATITFENQTVQDNYGVLWEKFMQMQAFVFYIFGFGIVFVFGLKILKLKFGGEE